MKKLKLIVAACALLAGYGSANADVDYTHAFSNAAWKGNGVSMGFPGSAPSNVALAECYYTTFGTGLAMKQTVSGLPNGNYDVEVYAQAHHANIGGFAAETMTNVNTLYVNSSSKALATVNNNGFADGEPTAYKFEDVSVTDGTMTIYINRDNNGANWFTMAVKSVVFKGTSAYVDYTSLIKNSSFESEGTGWDFSKSSGSNVTVIYPTSHDFRINGTHFAERFEPTGTVDARQTITAPATGYYRVGVAAYARGSEISSAKLFANGVETIITGINRYNVCIYVEKDANITFGVSATGKGGGNSWFAFDDFTLEYFGDASASNPIDVTSSISNPSFGYAYTTGWSLDGTAPNARNNDYGAYENYHRIGGLHQDITGLPNGVYKVTMQAAARYDGGQSGTFYLFATTSNGTTKTPATAAPGTNFATTAENMANDASYARIETYAVVTDGKLTIGHYESSGAVWPVFDNYTLTYYGAETEAYALALASEASKANAVITALETSSLKTSMSASYTSHNSKATLANIQWMTFVASSATELAEAIKTTTAAENIAAVEYTETTSGSHSTYSDAITAFKTAVSNASSTSGVVAATSTLKTAIKTYIANAKPSSESNYFDITCLIENPNFDYNTTDGWTYSKNGGTNAANFTCNEFFDNTFDFYQDLSGLPSGSYQLSVQAFSRPGDNGNTTAGAYYDYYNGTNKVTAELYLTSGGNTQASKVGNIYAYKANTTGAKVVGNDFNCTGLGDDNYWVPNNMKGASLYFADGAYTSEVATRVTDGNLRLGFRDETLTTHQWTIFDNFKLYYYGPSLMRYYQQYLPQLKAQVSEDLSNGTYTNVLVSSEDEALDAALAATPSAETEDAYQTVIDNLLNAQTAFRAAATSYDALVAAKASETLTNVSANIGTGVFQYNASTNNTLYSAYETAKGNVNDYTFTTSSTAAAAQALVDALNTATSNYNNQELNAPEPGKRYTLTLTGKGTLTSVTASTDGGYGMPFKDANANYIQAFTLAKISGNTYKMSFVGTDGLTHYVCNGLASGYNAGTGVDGIRTTTTEADALPILVEASGTDGVFYMLNTTAENNKKLGSNGGDFYTDNTYSNWTIAEATQASVNVTIPAAQQYATRIFPFAPSIDGVTFYSCEAAEGNQLTLQQVNAPAANVPYILFAEEGLESTDLSGWGAAAAETYAAGLLTGVYAATVAPDDSYVLANVGSKVGFYQVNNSSKPTVTANRAYLTAPAKGARAAFFFGDSETNGISAISALTSGQAEIYSEGGVRLQSLQKGLNIIRTKDGKTVKVTVK